jgi:hypothetical protein
MQTSEDAIFEIANTKVSDFVSYVWFVVSSIEALKKQITLEDLNSYLSSTLAWRQLDEVTKFRWSGVAKQALVKYTSTDPDKRKKWAKSGTSLSSNRRLDVVSRQLFDTILTIFIEEERYLNYEEMIELVFSDDYLSVLLNLPEAPKSGFRSRRNAPQDDVIEVDIKQLLLDWISGQDLNTLVNKHLKEISNVEYAYESLGDYLTSTFENYLPWVVGTVISWINNYPQAFTEGRNLVSPYFSAYIRYGVNNHVAVDLMVHGIRSRQLALALSTDYGFASEEGYDLKSWLQTLRIDDLVARYNASSSEINDFIKYINPDDSTFLADLIENQHAAISIYGLNCRSASSARLTKATSDNGNMSIFVTDNSGILFELPIQYHRDISSLLDTGLPHTVSVDCNDEITDITIEFIDFSQDV